MSGPTIARILWREIRDQLRDRRTLFMVVVLPILMYPMMGLAILQVSPVLQEKPRVVAVVGVEDLAEGPPLVEPNPETNELWFNPGLFDRVEDARALVVQTVPRDGRWDHPEACRELIRRGHASAVLVFPPDIAAHLRGERVTRAQVRIIYDGADERSEFTFNRVRNVLANYEKTVEAIRAAREGKPFAQVDPFRMRPEDVATLKEAGGSAWARLFPFLLVLMTLTGAFYPAIDVFAGERERGTLETLVLTPAGRDAIVIGKFLTIALVSLATALLNVVSMALTGIQLAAAVNNAPGVTSGHRGAEAVLSAPTLESLVWMLLLMPPLALFFAAISAAVANQARSMKEGQYFMTPLYLATIPILMLSMSPAVELGVSMALTPIAGPALLLRDLIKGDYATARGLGPLVLLATLSYAALVLRLTIRGFDREEALFRDAEPFHPALWWTALRRDRPERPTSNQAFLGFALMLTTAWFCAPLLSASLTGLILGQALFILAPPLALTLLLTRNPRATLRLRTTSAFWWLAALGLALCVNPALQELRSLIETLQPIPPQLAEALQNLTSATRNGSQGLVILGFAVVPAVCEELAFRGFILSGLTQPSDRRTARATAVALSALLFGLTHLALSLPQQFVPSTLLGLILGTLALGSRSLGPPLVFHIVNNTLAFLWPLLPSEAATTVFRDPERLLFQTPIVVVASVIALALVISIIRAAYPPDVANALPTPAEPHPVAQHQDQPNAPEAVS